MCKKVVKTSTTMTRANIFIARVVETGGVAPSFFISFQNVSRLVDGKSFRLSQLWHYDTSQCNISLTFYSVFYSVRL